MRTFIALSIAAVALADEQAAEHTHSVAASPVQVARAPLGAVRAPYGAYGRQPYAYGAYGARAPIRNNYGYASRNVINGGAAYSPYALRNVARGPAPMMARAPAPMMGRAPVPMVAPIPATKEGDLPAVEINWGKDNEKTVVIDHATDYATWRQAYLTAQAEKSEAVSYSPLLDPSWNYAGTSPVDATKAATLRDQYELQSAKEKMFAAEYALNQAAENDAPLEELQEIKKWYDYEKLNQMNIILGENPVMTYQLARQDYEWDATEAQEKINSASSPFEKRKAQLDYQEAQIDLLDALSPVMGGGMTYPGGLSTMVKYMADSAAAQGRQRSFEEAAVQYQRSPTAANMFELQIAELKLEKSEADYMRSMAGFVSPLAGLMNGNYRASMKFKKEQIESKIASLEEKLAAAKYEIAHGKEPFGRTGNLASEMKTQRAFFNLLTSGPSP